MIQIAGITEAKRFPNLQEIVESIEKSISSKTDENLVDHISIIKPSKKVKNVSEFFLGFKRIKGSYNQNWRWNE